MSPIIGIVRIVRAALPFVLTGSVLGMMSAAALTITVVAEPLTLRAETLTRTLRAEPLTGSHCADVGTGIMSSTVPTGSNRGAGVEIVSRVTSGNRIGLALRNDGVIGTGLAGRAPSLEFPLGTEIEHLVRAGIWVGGVTAQGDTLVSTAATATGAPARATASSRFGNEFLPLTEIAERSHLASSLYFSEEARSEQDLRYSFADYESSQPAEKHRPLQVQIDVETLQFSFEPYDAIVIMNCNIINLSQTDPIHDLYAGMYTELASGYKDPDDPNWSKDWFGQKDIEFLESLRLVAEHHFNLDGGRAPTWAGIQLLGTKPVPASSMTPSFNWWNWEDEIDGAGDAPTTDAQRYRMSALRVRGRLRHSGAASIS